MCQSDSCLPLAQSKLIKIKKSCSVARISIGNPLGERPKHCTCLVEKIIACLDSLTCLTLLHKPRLSPQTDCLPCFSRTPLAPCFPISNCEEVSIVKIHRTPQSYSLLMLAYGWLACTDRLMQPLKQTMLHLHQHNGENLVCVVCHGLLTRVVVI